VNEIDDDGSNVAVPVGEWMDVPAGMMAAPDTRPYPGYPGVLQSTVDNSVVCWHVRGCTRKGLHPSDVRMDKDTRAPWCPSCYELRPQKPVEH
jgi:hypothetical protein